MNAVFFAYVAILSWIWIFSCSFSMNQISEEKGFEKIVALSYLGIHKEINA